MDATLEELATRATKGDRAAVEQLVAGIQDRVYGLALRMLGDVEEARDATQEIILRVVTHLSGFRGEGKLIGWALRVATSHLLNFKAGRREAISFDALEEQLEQGLALFERQHNPTPYDAAVIEEGKLLCTQAMLLCLDRPQRLAFLLGEVLELPGAEAAAILDVDEAAFRKRLSRARERIESFAQRNCGLVEPKNRCRCAKQVHLGVAVGVIEPARLEWSAHPRLAEAAAEVVELQSAAAVLRAQPRFAAPGVFAERVRALLDATAKGPLGT